MKLYIDTTDRDNTNIAIIKGEKKLIVEKVEDESATPESVLNLINNGLNDLGIRLKDIDEIFVERGPGSFTGIRVGVAVANALSLTLNVPINGKKITEQELPKY